MRMKRSKLLAKEWKFGSVVEAIAFSSEDRDGQGRSGVAALGRPVCFLALFYIASLPVRMQEKIS